MNTEIVKYERQNGAGGAKPKKAKDTLISRISARANLTADERSILEAALEARDEWKDTSSNFEYVSEELLVDYYIYRLKACEARYTYFVRLAKEKGLSHFI
ncbi:MAG TPA: DUF2508 family protein [Clostridia bacterium]|nr:DUF2508 family protein [Clostridia bacterium]